MNVNELLAALPDLDQADAAIELPQGELQRIFADLSMRRPPSTSLHRMWTVGELSVQVALAYGARTVRGWFADAGERERQQLESNLRIALRIFHRLGYLRGALMKAGQLVGSMPNVVPAQIVDTLDRLRFAAPPMHFSLIREVIENDLGRGPEELFLDFEQNAFAAASIGQVHRATLKSGERVAVKIQYPGIARTIDADMRTITGLLTPLRLAFGADFVRKVEDVNRMLNQEADYKLEAESLGFARTLFSGRDDIVVPRVYPEYSGSRVLTMEYLAGLHVGEFLGRNPSQELRDSFGEKVCYAWYRMHAERMNYADPHSGNYIFMDDGRLGLIDFGCMQHFSEQEYDSLSISIRMAEGGVAAVREILMSQGVPESDLNEEFLETIVQSSRWITEPVRCSAVFDYGDPALLRHYFEWNMALAYNKSLIRNGTPMWLYYHRSNLALLALLYRLGARVDMSRLPIASWWNRQEK